MKRRTDKTGLRGAAAIAAAALLLAAGGCGGCGGRGASGVNWVAVPEHETRLGGLEWGRAGGFELAETEVTVRQWVEYLNDAGVADYPETPQVERGKKGYRAREGMADAAAGWVTFAEAESWCRWAGAKEGRTVRLPGGREWEAAARGGLDGARYPWGWSDPAPRQARVAAEGPLERAGDTEPNGFGLRDMAGNLYEWCTDARGGQRALRGGAWSEREPDGAACGAVRWQDAGARSADTGFRPLREGGRP